MKLNSIVIGGVILGAVALTMHSQNAAPKPALAAKVAVVAMRDAMLNTQDGRKAMAGMQAKFEPVRIGMEKRQTELQTMAEQLRKGAATMTPEAQQKLNDEIAAKKKTFDRDADDLNAEVEQEDNKLMQDLTVKMGGVIDEYAKQNGYTVVMDAAQPVLWAAETANVTPDIIKLYDQSSTSGNAATSSFASSATANPRPPSSGARPANPQRGEAEQRRQQDAARPNVVDGFGLDRMDRKERRDQGDAFRQQAAQTFEGEQDRAQVQREIEQVVTERVTAADLAVQPKRQVRQGPRLSRGPRSASIRGRSRAGSEKMA